MNAPLAAPAPTRRGRWRRRALLVLGALVALVALAPLYAGSFLRPVVEARLAEALAVRARVRAVSFGWPAHVRVHGLELEDPAGALLASLDDLDARVGLGALLAGRVEADVRIAYPEIHLARTEAGGWNWDRPLERVAALSGSSAPQAPRSEAAPAVRAHVQLVDGHVVLHGAQGSTTTLSDIDVELALEDLARPAPVYLALEVRGPEGPAGRVELAGSFVAAPEGRLDPLAASGEATLTVAGLELAGLGPALSLVAPVEGLAGRLEGRVALALAPGLALSGEGELDLAGLVVQGPRAAVEPARIERITLRLAAEQQGEGAGGQHLALQADSFLQVTYEGRSDLAPVGPGSVAGTLVLGADLGVLGTLARGWVPLQEGVAVRGRIDHRVELALTLEDRAPRTARIAVQGGVHELAATDAAGRALDLEALARIALALEAEADLAGGTLAVPRLELEAGPVKLQASGRAADLGGPSTPRLVSGELHLAGDLERLRGTLAQLVALDPRSLGGRVTADVTAAEGPAGLALRARLEGESLGLAGLALARVEAELEAQRGNDGALSGTGEVRTGELLWHPPEGAALALPASEVHLELAEDARGAGQHTLSLEAAGGALGLELRARSTRSGTAELSLEGALDAHGDVARLAALAAPLVPLQPGLAGALGLRGTLQAAVAEGTLAHADAALELVLTDLAARDAEGAELRLEALARTTVALEAALDARAGTAQVRRLALETGGLSLTATGRARGIGGAQPPEIEDGRLELRADLARLGSELARVVDLGGTRVDGSPLALECALSTREQRLETQGHVGLERLRLARPEEPPLELEQVALDFDLGYDLTVGSLHVRRAGLTSSLGTLGLNGTLNEVTTPERARGAMQLELGGDLARLFGALGLEPPDAGRRTSGTLAGKLKLEGDRGSFRVAGTSTVRAFRLELAPEEPDAQPVVVEDPEVALQLEARVQLAALDVALEKLALESRLARGGARGRIENLRGLGGEGARFVGVAGELAYVPDRLGAVLAPLLPGKLSGAEEQRVTFTLDGLVRELDAMALLAGTRARVDLGIGNFERPEIQLGGGVVLEAKDGTLTLRGDLGANGGTLRVDGTLDPGLSARPARSRLTIGTKELRATPGLAPLLALVHPAFATAQAAAGSLDGRVALDLDVTYDGPLTLEALEAGWDALPKQPIHGTGRLELRDASLRGSPLVKMLSDFGVDASRSLDVRPIEFTIQKGRIQYARPWTWTLSGVETSFTGSLGLDESLDLAWNVPVTEALIQRWEFLSFLRGETLSIPLRGTARSPRLETESLLKDLAAQAARKELEGRLGLGGSKDGEDPAALLAKADDLWGRGKKSEAAALYLRLREDFKLSLTYALNKDRIKDRSKYQEPK